MGGTTIATTQGTLQVGEWTQVSVFFAYSTGGTCAASIHFGDILQTPETETNIFTNTTFTESASDDFKVGGFKGSIQHFNIFGPGSAQISSSKYSSLK